MWAFHARLQPLITAIGAWNQVALGTREQIDHQTQQVEEKDHQHPQDRAVHPARLGIASHPHQQRDAQRQAKNRDEKECTAATARPQAAKRIGKASNRTEQRKAREYPERLEPKSHNWLTFWCGLIWPQMLWKTRSGVNRKLRAPLQ